ncbi:MAG: TlpA family protein disulfide reductase [Acidobacteria bacterium]|nr:TlpA family protein disulfide reductase [Acidobacteriota bacterium]MBI3421616.1 TlpA family protein disulfide reductase [Acidobacteriota bacterium]
MKRNILPLLVFLLLTAAAQAQTGALTRTVRLKLSAGDLASGAHAAEDYKLKTGVDAEYLDAVGWLARGAEMLRQYDAAAQYVAELRREIKEEKSELLAPLGAAIEVEGRLLAVHKGRQAAKEFWEKEFAVAKNIGLRARLRKNINLLFLTGQPAPELNPTDFAGPQPPTLASLKGKPVLLFLWAHWCGDCRAQAAALSRVYQKYEAQGLVLLAPTRFYGTGAQDKSATPAEEKAHLAKVWAESYTGLEGVPIPIETEMMVRYGVAATPTFVLIDRKGIVRLYAPTRLSEAELARQIEAILKTSP